MIDFNTIKIQNKCLTFGYSIIIFHLWLEVIRAAVYACLNATFNIRTDFIDESNDDYLYTEDGNTIFLNKRNIHVLYFHSEVFWLKIIFLVMTVNSFQQRGNVIIYSHSFVSCF